MREEAGAPPESVLAHGESLRSLARALLGDRDAAEDAVQDTWVRYLESRPTQGAGLGGWLATVLRRLVSNRKREAARRAERERASARRESVDEPSLRDREQALRSVVEAVLALEEPYKAVVLLRWFEGLPPREIAARLGIDAGVVHTRLSRAHEKLRGKLERDLGAARSRACLVCLAGLGRSPLAPWTKSAGGGAAVMAGKALLIGSGAVVALCGALWYGLATDEEGHVAEALAHGPEASEPELAFESGGSELAAAEPVRNEAPQDAIAQSEPEFAPWAAPSFEYQLEVSVVDALDLPVARHTVLAAPAGHTLNDVGSTDANGQVLMRWRGFEAAMELDLAIDSSGSLRRVRVAAGAQRVALRKEGSSAVPTSISFTIKAVESGSGEPQILEGVPLVFDNAIEGVAAERDADGRLLFVEPALVKAEPAVDPTLGQLIDRLRLGSESVATVSGGAVLNFTASRPASSPGNGTVRGRLFDADGRAIADATVLAWRDDVKRRPSVRTEANGEYTLKDLAPGDWHLRAGGGDHGRAEALATISAGQVFEWETRLARGLELKGRLFDALRVPLAGWWIEVECEDAHEPVADATKTGDDGSFAIPNLPARMLRLYARRASEVPGCALPVAAGVLPGESVLEFVLDTRVDAEPGSLALEAGDVGGAEVNLVRARAWRRDTGREVEGEVISESFVMESSDGSRSAPTPRPTATLFENLSSGWYTVELQFAGRAALELPPVFVPAGEAVQLGEVSAPAAARLQLAGPSGPLAELTFVQRAPSVELRCSAKVPGSSLLQLADGDYQLTLKQGEALTRHRLQLSAGSTSSL